MEVFDSWHYNETIHARVRTNLLVVEQNLLGHGCMHPSLRNACIHAFQRASFKCFWRHVCIQGVNIVQQGGYTLLKKQHAVMARGSVISASRAAPSEASDQDREQGHSDVLNLAASERTRQLQFTLKQQALQARFCTKTNDHSVSSSRTKTTAQMQATKLPASSGFVVGFRHNTYRVSR